MNHNKEATNECNQHSLTRSTNKQLKMQSPRQYALGATATDEGIYKWTTLKKTPQHPPKWLAAKLLQGKCLSVHKHNAPHQAHPKLHHINLYPYVICNEYANGMIILWDIYLPVKKLWLQSLHTPCAACLGRVFNWIKCRGVTVATDEFARFMWIRVSGLAPLPRDIYIAVCYFPQHLLISLSTVTQLGILTWIYMLRSFSTQLQARSSSWVISMLLPYPARFLSIIGLRITLYP